MQTIIQVLCKSGNSLRDLIANDPKLEDYDLELIHSKRQHRNPGWAKLRSTTGEWGAINFEWNSSSRTLTCRVVTRKQKKPFNIIGDFIAYLLARQSNKIVTIVMS